ncbi:TRAP transporter large permease [Aliihoeflea sp. 40Bstr573]|uniref:TRAP transporter large permease n=1 Tax=Aliihoeflea sp. 40Bstr573 TaxID=2696467 RepID=UPI0020951362|nr:TRAP transporter large permease [Aliihoeflea sp. 40Bstr573]MCO6386143.1 TRAP transporter large permease subunit [Aliihoeflea sp. 40Bstr573]
MSNLELGLWSFPALLFLIFLRIPIALAMLITGLVGTYLIMGSPTPILSRLKGETYSTFSSYSLSIIPLFLLMGQFASLGGMSQSLFNAANSWLGHRKGGVAMSAIGACAGFGAICGSSLATAATMAQVALPELKRHGYSGALATGTLAAGGTLGILIPPSVVLVIYAILAEQNIAKLFVAAFVPGILAAIGYMIAIAIYVRLYPESAGSSERQPYSQRFRALFDVWPVLLVFIAVVGGIYTGWFTPTEAAAIGAAGTGLIAWINGGLTRKTMIDSILMTASATAMIFFIVFGAAFYNSFLALSQMPVAAATFITSQGFDPMMVLIGILIFYIVLGCFMDSLSMILLTIPIFFPIVSQLDYGLGPEEFALWFGILVLIVVEVGLITPPVGMNLFVINSMDRSTPIVQTYKGVMPFVTSDMIRTIVLLAFPPITLFLVRLLY